MKIVVAAISILLLVSSSLAEDFHLTLTAEERDCMLAKAKKLGVPQPYVIEPEHTMVLPASWRPMYGLAVSGRERNEEKALETEVQVRFGFIPFDCPDSVDEQERCGRWYLRSTSPIKTIHYLVRAGGRRFRIQLGSANDVGGKLDLMADVRHVVTSVAEDNYRLEPEMLKRLERHHGDDLKKSLDIDRWPEELTVRRQEEGLLYIMYMQGALEHRLVFAQSDRKKPALRRLHRTYVDPLGAFRPIDTDGDGVHDLRELQLGFCPRDPQDGLADPDDDGFPTGEEMQAGTDFRDRDDHPLLITRLRFLKVVTPIFPIQLKAVADSDQLPKQEWDLQLLIWRLDKGRWENELGVHLNNRVKSGDQMFDLVGLERIKDEGTKLPRYKLIVEDQEGQKTAVEERAGIQWDERNKIWLFAYFFGNDEPRILQLKRGMWFTLEGKHGHKQRYLLQGPEEEPWVYIEQKGGTSLVIEKFYEGEFEAKAEHQNALDGSASRRRK